MKKFHFPLETVLSYKQQMLDAQQAEHATIIAAVQQQEAHLHLLREKYEAYANEYREHCAAGMDIKEVLAFQAGLRAHEREMQQETIKLEKLHQQEEEKRMEVVAAKQDTSSIEKLKGKQIDLYNAAAAKSEEMLIEEFVSSRRCVAGR